MHHPRKVQQLSNGGGSGPGNRKNQMEKWRGPDHIRNNARRQASERCPRKVQPDAIGDLDAQGNLDRSDDPRVDVLGPLDENCP